MPVWAGVSQGTRVMHDGTIEYPVPLLFRVDPSIVAIATGDGELAKDPGQLPRLSINDPVGIAAFVLDFIGRGERLGTEVAC